MRFEAIQFFGNVNSLCQQNQLLLQTVVFQLHLSIFQLRDQTLTLPLQDFRHMGADFDHFGGDAFQTLLDQCFQRLTFGFACDDKVVQRTIQRRENFSGNRVEILLLGCHYPRPAENINRVDFPFVTLHFYPVRGSYQLFSQFFVEDQLTLCANIWFIAQGTFHFTARQARTNTLANDRFKATELLRQTKVSFQITLVYRAHFPGCAPPFTLDFTPGVGGHTADHRRSCL